MRTARTPPARGAGPSPVGLRSRARRGLAAHALTALVAATAASAQVPDPPPLFASHDVLPLTLTADLARLDGDRSSSPDRPATVTVVGPDGAPVEIGAEVRTRGSFRLDPASCSFPPLRIDVVRRSAEGTVFAGQDDLKIVSSCRPGRASYDELVVLEYLAYRAYAVLTDRAFRVRPLELTLVDAGGAAAPTTRFAFLIEDDEALAERLGASVFELEEGRNLPPAAFDPVTTLMTAVFEYMIGNPDWSDVAGHNVEIVDRGGTALAVPYDFDFSGLVDAPYASADPAFGLSSVRERYYRGWCANPVTTGLVLGRFRESREEVLELFAAERRLGGARARRAIAYLEEFFDGIATDERARRRFLRDCRTPGA